MLWGFEGKELLVITVGFGFAIGCFRYCYGTKQWNALLALGAASVPLIATIAWVTLLVSGKPKRYANEWFEWLLLRFQCRANLATTFLSPSRHRTGSEQIQHPIFAHHGTQD